MNEQSKQQIVEMAHKHDEVEICGFLVRRNKKEQVYHAQNMSDEPWNTFRTSPQDWLEASSMGKIMSVFHSHPGPKSETPSMADKVACNRSMVPWWIYSLRTKHWGMIVPDEYVAPLLGREWCHGVLDCYSMIRDWYRYTEKDDPLGPGLGIELLEFPRDDHWWNNGGSLYEDGYPKTGFVSVPKESLRKHDVILMGWDAPTPHHAAISMEGNMILHHMYGRLSGRVIYGRWYRDRTMKVIRHRELLRPGDLIDEHDKG